MLKVSLNQEKLNEIRLLSQCDNVSLEAASKRFVASNSFTSRGDIVSLLSVDIPEQISAVIASIVIGFTSFAESTDTTANEVLESLLISAEADGLEQDVIAALKPKVAHLIAMVQSRKATLIGKAAQLIGILENQVGEIEVLVDVRPILSPERASISGAIVYGTLCVPYTSADSSNHVLTATIELQQLRKLEKEVSKAIAKISVVQDFFKSKGVTWIVGEQD